ncbi:FdtA/QdtA family cupin domain-containing protein [Candidatus Gracilibacteria bacterium]|nr:FdtA/QdtA family cupin domain-containing protein [Candidatus Gracilibacteria bacterium]
MKKFEILTLPLFSDDRGETIPLELDSSFPFEVKRVYFVSSNQNAVRGGHAHKIEDELFIAVSGEITALINDGSGDKEIVLDQKNKALLVRKGCWHEFKNFSKGAILTCFSSTHYLPGETNYICDKSAFLDNTDK